MNREHLRKILRGKCVTNEACEAAIDEVLNLHIVSDQKELLCDFFKFFRDNGEANIGMTIEQFIDGYISHNSR